jgi:hypothetical protein
MSGLLLAMVAYSAVIGTPPVLAASCNCPLEEAYVNHLCGGLGTYWFYCSVDSDNGDIDFFCVDGKQPEQLECGTHKPS